MMAEKRQRQSIRSLDTGPLIDLHINLPQNILTMLDEMKDDLHVSRSVVVRTLIENEYRFQHAEGNT